MEPESKKIWYYIKQGNNRLGPFTVDQLSEQVVSSTTLVWFEGQRSWKKIRDIPELTPLYQKIYQEHTKVSRPISNIIFVVAILLCLSVITIWILKNSEKANATLATVPPATETCDVIDLLKKFYTIKPGMNYDMIKKLMGKDGNNFRTDLIDADKIRYFKWSFCTTEQYELECWFKTNIIVLAKCNFYRHDGTAFIAPGAFKKITPGMTYKAVCKLMGAQGKKYRMDFNKGHVTSYYFWSGKSSGQEIRYEVWFNGNKMIHKSIITGKLKRLMELEPDILN